MGSNISSPHAREVLDAIRRIVQALRESSRAAEKRVGLSSAQLFVLQTLAESPGLSLNELAERTRTHQSSVSAVVSHGCRRSGSSRRNHRSRRCAPRGDPVVGPRTRTAGAARPAAAQERLVATVDAMPPAERARLAAFAPSAGRGWRLPKQPAGACSSTSPLLERQDGVLHA
mgnify:CR=1 FL=1